MTEPSNPRGLAGLVSRVFKRDAEPGAPGAPKPETPPAPPTLRVTSHVARDLLQNAAYFNSVPKAVTEYVTNAIDNAPADRAVRCEVTLSREEIRIADNASGMTYTELFNFFRMHGENVQRQRGRAVRGKFGTGKSAAFGIANVLRIETVKAGKRNVVELSSADVQAARDGEPIPVRELSAHQSTSARAGTTIIISSLNAKNVDADATRAYLIKTPGRHLRRHQVSVNGIPCQYREPALTKVLRFKPPRETAERLGAVTCTLKIAQEPLTRDENVIAVLSNGYLHAGTLAGKAGEPFVEYIFGEVEVPSLDEENDAIPAFDNTRSLTLNQQNPRVQALLAWLADCIEEVRRELVERDKRRRYSKEMRLLRKVAGEIEGFLAEDFTVVQETLPWATMPGSRRRKTKGRHAGAAKRELPLPPIPEPTLAERGRAWINRLLRRPVDPDEELPAPPVRRAGKVQFEINCIRMGRDAPRARYIANRRAIYLNRDHPLLHTAEAEAGLTSLTYKMLLFDVAATEYALAVVSQLADQGIEVADPVDASEMAQEILDRLNRKAAEAFFAEMASRKESEPDQTEPKPPADRPVSEDSKESAVESF